jgi:hypothetical protein
MVSAKAQNRKSLKKQTTAVTYATAGGTLGGTTIFEVIGVVLPANLDSQGLVF